VETIDLPSDVLVLFCRIRNTYCSSVTISHLEKLSLNFSSSPFVIRVNLLHPLQSLFPYGLLLSFFVFTILVMYYFQVSFNLKVILYVTKITESTVTVQETSLLEQIQLQLQSQGGKINNKTSEVTGLIKVDSSVCKRVCLLWVSRLNF